VKTTALGIIGGLVLGISAVQLYDGLAMGVLSCADRHQSPECEANYVRTAVAEVGAAIGLVSAVAALWCARRSRGEAKSAR
jgi:hypothetical protein